MSELKEWGRRSVRWPDLPSAIDRGAAGLVDKHQMLTHKSTVPPSNQDSAPLWACACT